MRLVKGLSGVLLGQAATLSAGPLDGAWFKGTTDKCPIDYQVGEAMTFTVTPMEVGELLSPEDWQLDWTDALGYYDAAIVASLVPKTCKVVITRAGLGDYICPPTGLARLYNALECPKKIVWSQGSEHGYLPPRYEGRDTVREED